MNTLAQKIQNKYQCFKGAKIKIFHIVLLLVLGLSNITIQPVFAKAEQEKAEKSFQPVVLPSNYFLPFGADAGPVRVSRTGYLYKSDYSLAGLANLYDDSDYHGNLDGTSLKKENRAAIDFALSNGQRVLAAAPGTVTFSNNCEVMIQSGNDLVLYAHHSNTSNPMVHKGDVVVRGQQIAVVGGYAGCNAIGPHLHFAIWRGNIELPVYFQNAPAQNNNGHTCPAGLICPSHTGRVEFRYTGGGAPVVITPTPPTWIPFQGSPSSRLFIDQNGARANLTVCADNIVNQTVYVIFWRNGREWNYSGVATSRCITFWDMDGAGSLFTNTDYFSVASLRVPPNKNWPIPCYVATGGVGLCDKVRR